MSRLNADQRRVFTAARKLIADAPHLLQGSFTNNPEGIISFTDYGASPKPGDCFCTVGAIMAAAQRWQVEETYLGPLMRELDLSCGYEIYDWSDDHTKDDVLALFDRVLAL